MTTFYTDFRGETIGNAPAGLSLLFGSVTFQVQSGNPLAGSDRSLLIQLPSGNYVRSAIAADGVTTSGITKVRVLGNFQGTTDVTNGSIVGAFLSGTGSDSTRTGYFQWHRQNYSLSRYDNGADPAVESVNKVDITTAVESWYLEILRDGSLVELRSWRLVGESRPATATASFTDPSPLPVSGSVGISAVLKDTVTNPDFIVYELSAATDGDALPDGPTFTTVRKGSQFTVEETITGAVTSATLNGNAIQVDSHIGTTVTLTDTGSGITTSGQYSLVLTDDTAATETITVQVNVVGVAPSNNPVEKDGAAQASLTGVQVRVTDGANLNGTELYYTGTATTDASGNLASIDLSNTAAVETDPVLLHIRTAAGDSITASETVGLI